MTADAAPAVDVQPKAKIFISYSRKDLTFVDQLEAALKARGFEPLIDRTEIYAFEEWWERIQALIGRADTVVFVLSPDAVASDVALKEVAHAASLNKRFAPIVCRRTDDGAVPEALRRLNFIFFDDPARFEASADQLAEALRTDIGWVRQHTEFGEAARRWTVADRKSGLLLRSPMLEEAERWIASRPPGAPEPTKETQGFVAESRRGATKRRNILTGSLAAGFVVALVLAGLAYWQREVAVQQRQIADQQRKHAEDTLAAATQTANSLVFDLAQRFRNTTGIPAKLVKDILDRARALQDQLIKSDQVTPELRRSQGVALIEIVESLKTIGDTKAALAAAEQARQILADLLASSPTDTGYQRDLSVAYGKVGDVLVAQGNLLGALKSYQALLAIAKRLTRSDPGNADWQYDLGIANERIGDVLMAQGDLAGALKSYQAKRDIISRLSGKADTAGWKSARNAGWQRDLSVAYEEVGRVQELEGDLPGALKSFQDDLAVAQRLAQSDSSNADLQREQSVAYNKVGDVQMTQGDLAGALKSYRDSLAIVQRLTRSDPGNAGWQQDMSLSNNKVGAVLEAQGDLAGALKFYRGSLSIRERLMRSDPSNAKWQHQAAFSNELIGRMLSTQGDLDGALKSFQEGLAIFEQLAKSYPGNETWQRDLAVAGGEVGAVQQVRGDLADALKSYHNVLAVLERLARSDPSNTTLQRDVIITCVKIAEINRSEASGMLTRALEIAKDLQTKKLLAPSDGWMLDELTKRLAALPTN